MTDGRDPTTGRLRAGHQVRPLVRGGEAEAVLIRRHLEPRKVEVLNKLGELAAAGDPRSIELYLRYFSPGARPEDEKISVPGLAEAGTMEEKAQAIVQAVSSGAISATAGTNALALLEKYAKLVIADDHERRLHAIETGRATALAANAVDIEDIC